MKCIIDADSFAFRAAIAAEKEDVLIACANVDFLLNNALNELDAKSYELYLSGKDNFRYKIYPEYKAHRYDKSRPKWEQAVKRHLIDQWQAEVIDGIEGDDACGIKHNENTIVIHQDKDLNQLKGWHYNFVKHEKYYVTPQEADKYFFYQLLVGDPADGIKGASGIGKIKAERLLHGLHTNQEMYEVVQDYFSCEEELEMNATCVYIQRKENDNWRSLIGT